MRLVEVRVLSVFYVSTFFAVLGFFSCVLLSIVYNLDEATATHCKVPNYLPSISASIGDFTPQAYIWRICIALHCGPRFLVAFAIYSYYKIRSGNLSAKFLFLNGLNSLLTIVENVALLILTYVSSRENFGVHEKAFIIFMVCSMCYMLTSCILFNWASKKPMTNEDSRIFKRNLIIMFSNYSSFAMAVYFYFRHNWFCEPGIYSLFAVCEYVTVLTNIWYHAGLSYHVVNGMWFTIGHQHTS